jgi:adenine phosphoribosyltransferase
MPPVNYHALIREVPDFPKPGILFYDITTLLKDAQALASIVDELTAYYQGQRIAKVIGIESRGFIFGGILANRLNAGFVPVRKPGKLPADNFEVKYSLEYGTNSLAIHRDAIGRLAGHRGYGGRDGVSRSPVGRRNRRTRLSR